MRHVFYLACLLLVTVSLQVQSSEQRVQAEGSFKYGPDLSKNLACSRAKLNLRINALRAVVGERLNQFSSLDCDSLRSKTYENECRLREFVWSQMGAGAFIRSVEIKQEIDRPVTDARQCLVSGQVIVKKVPGKPDPLFVNAVEIYPSNLLQEGEVFEVRLDSSQKAFHYLFAMELDSSPQKLELLFPSGWDDQNYFEGRRDLPSRESSSRYQLQATLDEGGTYSLEQLILLSSKTSLGDSPTINDLTSLIRTVGRMKRKHWTVSDMVYEIVKRAP